MTFLKSKDFGGCAVMLGFTLFWCGITGLFDGILFHGAIKQWQALDYPTTTGTVVSSQVTGAGKHIHAEIVTRFEVGGKTYETREWRYGAWDGSGAGSAVPRHPAGSHPAVHYPPENPADAILEPGLQGHDGFLWLFLTPFNLVGILLLWSLAHAFRQWWAGRQSPKSLRNAFWKTEGTVQRIRLNYPQQIGGAFFILFAGPILSVIVLAVTGLKDFSFWVPFGVWLALIASAAFACLRGFARIKTGDHDLLLDRTCGNVTLPVIQGGKTFFLRELTSANVFSTTSTRRGKNKTTSWHLRIGTRDGKVHDCDTDSEPIARAAARELRLAAGLPDDPFA